MNQYEPKHLFGTLKRLLKEKKISYRALAGKVSFSEGTIKKLFHEEDAPLHRICEISHAIGVPFPDLVAAAYAQNTREFSFSEEQETFFTLHPGHYNFFREIFFGGKPVDQVCRERGLSNRSGQRYLQDLERLRILERHPQGKISFKVQGRLTWLPGGPWMRKYFSTYSQAIAQRLLQHPQTEGHLCSFSYARLSKSNRDQFYLEIQEVARRFKDVSHKEHLVGNTEDSVPVTWLFGMVPVDIVSHTSAIPELQG